MGKTTKHLLCQAMTEPLLIEHSETLAAFAAGAAAAPWLGIDTEFVRDRTYFPRPGLIQIATPESIGLLDPVALTDLSPLARLLNESSAVKIFHAARQDLELFFNLFGAVPRPLFDTQVAAGMVGLASQIGYATLVAELLGRETTATLGRYDWLKRPIATDAIAYAAGDVRHLGDLHAILYRRLAESERSGAFAQAMRQLGSPELYLPDPAAAWQRVRAARRLSGAALARFKALAAWRESRAIGDDRPRQWIVRDAALVAIAKWAPNGGEELARIKSLDKSGLRRYATAITEVLVRTAGESGKEN